jgi:hypothetical protein
MKKIVHKMKQRKFTTLTAFLLVLCVIMGVFTLVGIFKNLNQMAAEPPQSDYNFATYPPTNTEGKDPTEVERGKYLVTAGDCIACVTGRMSNLLKPCAMGFLRRDIIIILHFHIIILII